MSAAPPAPTGAPAAPGTGLASAPLQALLLALSLAVGLRLVSGQAFAYDEADYMHAVAQGFWANSLDRPTIPLGEFLALGLGQGRAPAQQRDLSSYIRAQEDITFYRHFHGPLYFYWQMLARLLPGPQEYRARLASLLLLPLTGLALGLACRLLLGRDPWAVLAAGGLAVGLLAFCRPSLLTAAEVTPHALFAPVSLGVLVALARFMQRPSRRALALAALLTGLALATIEYAALLLATMLACLALVWWLAPAPWRGAAPSRKGQLGLAALVLLLGLLAVWPGSLLRLTILKNYTFFAYFTLVRSQAAYGGQDALWVWGQRLAQSPLEFVALALALATSLRQILAKRQWWLAPFLIYALLLLATTLRNKSLSPTYLSSLYPPVFLLVGLAWAQAIRRWPHARQALATLALVAAVLSFNYLHGLAGHGENQDSLVIQGVVDTYRQQHLEHLPLLVPQEVLPSLHYYFPRADLRGYSPQEAAQGLGQLASRQGRQGVIALRPAPGLPLDGYGEAPVAALPRAGFHLYLRPADGPGER